MKNTFSVYRLLLAIVLIILHMSATAQLDPNYITGEALVKVAPNADIRHIVQDLQDLEHQATDLAVANAVVRSMRIWRLQFSESINHNAMLNALKAHPAIEVAQSNHKIEFRNTPNDQQFNQQWQYINTGQSGGTAGADIDADSAWDIATGGLTALGDTIVVCIIDGGIDVNHNDLTPNRWFNWAEIPNNNIDDDNNGFVDDYLGWSTGSNNDNISGNSHGTAVAGIIGAKGDNGIGVTGINWDVKMMIIKGGTGIESEVLTAYSYPLEMRKRYNATNGQEGAFVVATNASWGVDGGQPSNAPLWCAMYDTLGHYGILNMGAGPNMNVDVDVFGDLPTACPSEYLIGVTNMNHNDNKVTQACYGTTHIDLGAFGEGTWTSTNNNGTAPFGGTSGATPHVTGSVALLYASPCPSLVFIAKSNPKLSAELARDYILNNVDPNTSIANITATGGRLNLYQSLKNTVDSCIAIDCLPPFGLTHYNVTDSSMMVAWNAITDTTRTFILKYRELGATNWTTTTDTLQYAHLQGLTTCNTYEVIVEMICDNDTSASQLYLFETEGCCTAPEGLIGTPQTDSSAWLSWDDEYAAQSYIIYYRPVGASVWQTDTTTADSILINNLMTCLSYEFQIEMLCDSGVVVLSDLELFQSACGNCTELAYCPARGDTQYEFIESISINNFTNATGNDGGYYWHDGLATALQKTTYTISVTPGFVGTSFNEGIRAWIDFNQDGDFEDANEMILQNTVSAGTATASFAVPVSAPNGITRMRVAMHYNQHPTSCRTDLFGEVEDYCITILDTSACQIPFAIDTLAVSTTSLQLEWNADSSMQYLIRYRPSTTPTWSYANANALLYTLTNLTACTNYIIEIANICPNGDTTVFSMPAHFSTSCLQSSRRINDAITNVQLFPNPSRGAAALYLAFALSDAQDITITLLNTNGQIISTQAIGKRVGRQQIALDVPSDLPSGIYIIQLRTAKGDSYATRWLKY